MNMRNRCVLHLTAYSIYQMNIAEDYMKEIKLTPEQQKLFNANFNREAYEEAKKPIQEAISGSKSFDELWNKLQKHECDVEYEDDCTIISCEVELDRSHMETEGDYVGACFFIKWYDEADSGMIDKVELYTSETSNDYLADLLCCIHPETCEITEWVYDNIDDKQ